MKKKLLMLLMATTLTFGLAACGDAKEAETETEKEVEDENDKDADDADEEDAEDEDADEEDADEEDADEEDADESREDVEYDAKLLNSYMPEDNFLVKTESQGVNVEIGKSGDCIYMSMGIDGNKADMYYVDGILYADVTAGGESAKLYAEASPEETGMGDTMSMVDDVNQKFDSIEFVESQGDIDVVKAVADSEEYTFYINAKDKVIDSVETVSDGETVKMEFVYDFEVSVPFTKDEAEKSDAQTVAMSMFAVLFSGMQE